MTRREVSVRIGGSAGDGVASTGEIFGRTCSRSGLHVYAYNSYQSVIRGGHVWFQVRAGNERVPSVGKSVDILIALNRETVDVHLPSIREGGGILYDPKKVKIEPGELPPKVQSFPMPALEMAQKISKNPIIVNTVLLGAAMEFLGAPLSNFTSVIEDQFGHKKTEVVEQNVRAAQEGWNYASREWGPLDFSLAWGSNRRLFLTGNQAIALGALAAGCRFYSFYPMTPASSIGHFLAEHGPQHGMVVKQAEDEIAVVNMAIGASFAGARAMCGTSGGGFSLMVEAMGFAGMIETPLVVVDSQRAGPSTGLPTKTEQGDLQLVLGAGQGDWPRIVLSPRNVEEAFYLTAEAFNLADRYQTPVILLSDLLLSEHYETVDSLDFDVRIDRGDLRLDGDLPQPFLRYLVTPSGISPRSIPGVEGGEHVAGSDEHDEDGTLVSDVRAGIPDAVEVRRRQMEKRMRKLEGARKEAHPPLRVGPSGASVTILSWGSTQGAVREALAILSSRGIRAESVEVDFLWPFPSEAVVRALSGARHLLLVEGNYSGQFERLLRAETGLVPDSRLRKYDGEPFFPEEIVEKVESVLQEEKRAVRGEA